VKEGWILGKEATEGWKEVKRGQDMKEEVEEEVKEGQNGQRKVKGGRVRKGIISALIPFHPVGPLLHPFLFSPILPSFLPSFSILTSPSSFTSF
jgi:hypothetical protein